MQQITLSQALNFEHHLNPELHHQITKSDNDTIYAIAEQLDSPRKVAFLNLVDAMGKPWILKHQELLEELELRHWKKASWMVMCSPLSTTCPGRAHRIADGLANGDLSEYLSVA
ncbi:hypothetical protein [Dongshaea marina]|uniref:hypothetical protein n=1 Tax=Dongshaea marina TaxID=2047966 RepID=UPI000D3E300C|nr:hypothetical protein [Dongshaea marina]